MDTNTNDRDPDIPAEGSQGELEEALKWLEELTARQGKATDLSNPVPPAYIDSPFRGLIDDDEGDLPDWLREVPGTSGVERLGEGEPESRLDWLAKMAQRESIEELPTLEWRRLSEPVQSAILPPAGDEIIGPPASELEPDPDIVVDALDNMVDSEVTAVVENEEPITSQPAAEGHSSEESESLASNEPAQAFDEVNLMVTEEPLQSFDDLPVSLEIEPDDELPSMDDLDAAMAWIEELAASLDAPIEEIPSVADRALASKLMAEAGLPSIASPLDELGSDSEMLGNVTPTHPFIEEEDFADTVILVETMAAEQNLTSAIPVAIAIEEESVEEDAIVVEESEPTIESLEEAAPAADALTNELSFEEAMAYLDHMAEDQAPVSEPVESLEPVDNFVEEAILLGTAVAIENQAAVEIEATDSQVDEVELSTHEIALLALETEVTDSDMADTAIDEATEQVQEEELDVASGANIEDVMVEDKPQTATVLGREELEAALLALDALALPVGRTLDDIDASLRTAQVTPLRDVSSALDWLESNLARNHYSQLPSAREMDEEDSIAQMPEDPDAVLAWLEQIAKDETELSVEPTSLDERLAVVATSETVSEPLIEEWAEADLLDMPEDPDEAMAWLEGLARGSDTAAGQRSPSPTADEPIQDVLPEIESVMSETVVVEEDATEAVPTEPITIEEIAADAVVTESIVEESPDALLPEPATDKRPRKRAASKEEAEREPLPAEEKSPAAWVDLLKPLD